MHWKNKERTFHAAMFSFKKIIYELFKPPFKIVEISVVVVVVVVVVDGGVVVTGSDSCPLLLIDYKIVIFLYTRKFVLWCFYTSEKIQNSTFRVKIYV